jgi:hypothetical protein
MATPKKKSKGGAKKVTQKPAPAEATAEATAAKATSDITTENTAEIDADVAAMQQEAQAKGQETTLTSRPSTAIAEQVKAAGFSSMGVGPVTAEDREERQLSDDRTAQILERSRIGTALFYVPILNPVWKVGYLGFPPSTNVDADQFPERPDAQSLDQRHPRG